MASARTECPNCQRDRVTELREIFFAPDVDFFRCEDCGFLWHVPKGEEGPPSQALLRRDTKTREDG
jgi:hypothetical protein